MEGRALLAGPSAIWRRASPLPAVPGRCASGQRSAARAPRNAWQAEAAQAVAATAAPVAEALPVLRSVEPAVEPVERATTTTTAQAANLTTRLTKAHSSTVSAALVVQDTSDEQLIATASLDKGMACWRLFWDPAQGEAAEEQVEMTRLKVPGAPVFSLAKIPEVLPDGTVAKRKPTAKPPGIYLGTAGKEVLTWMLGSKDVTDKVVLDGHTGWVRALAVTDKYLFSCGCNWLRAWDTTFRTPKEVAKVALFTGDILAMAASQGRVYTAGADGSLRSWAIRAGPAPGSGASGNGQGVLEEGPAVEKAHEGRVAACVVHGGLVYTVSYDGSIKAWDARTLAPVHQVLGAHAGEKLFCVAMGANGVLFTGGDDKAIRAWTPELQPVGEPLGGHTAPVRVLAAGRRGLLVSGDSEGDVCIWETCAVGIPSAAAAAAGSTAFGNGGLNGGSGAAAHLPPLSSVDVGLSEEAMLALEELFQAPRPVEAAAVAMGAAAGEMAASGAAAECAAAAAAAAERLHHSIAEAALLAEGQQVPLHVQQGLAAHQHEVLQQAGEAQQALHDCHQQEAQQHDAYAAHAPEGYAAEEQEYEDPHHLHVHADLLRSQDEQLQHELAAEPAPAEAEAVAAAHPQELLSHPLQLEQGSEEEWVEQHHGGDSFDQEGLPQAAPELLAAEVQEVATAAATELLAAEVEAAPSRLPRGTVAANALAAAFAAAAAGGQEHPQHSQYIQQQRERLQMQQDAHDAHTLAAAELHAAADGATLGSDGEVPAASAAAEAAATAALTATAEAVAAVSSAGAALQAIEASAADASWGDATLTVNPLGLEGAGGHAGVAAHAEQLAPSHNHLVEAADLALGPADEQQQPLYQPAQGA